jgi:phospholipase A-2-activating protein
MIDDKRRDIYNLAQSIAHHKNILRTVTCNRNNLAVTGSFDKTCALYIKESSIYSVVRDFSYHDDYIYIARSLVTDKGFLTGSKDSKIILVDNEGNPLNEFIGHSQTVNSISQYDPDTFISGSWDTTARVWDINTGKVKYMMKDHAYAVCCLALPNERFITGSQDKKLRFWDKDKLINTIDNAHDDIIRDIILDSDQSSIYTCSNDYTIKQWNFSGQLLATLSGHEGFVFRILKKGEYLFSASDDKFVKIWKNGVIHQDLFHPNTIWDIALDSDDDLLTGIIYLI